ncbi:hypothetical protein CAC42_2785 [Sphaceloma murrayae]|uniref:DUF7492 domain-containing protein n=1 Tax=Sphaceloma murrayae TaxID=2082308 RepID=A0A2K1R0M9_9PEZI|nr:hypothetical protein CAC42_2785 [Sphaceloma murrayae]
MATSVSSLSMSKLTLLIAVSAGFVSAHSWVEQMQEISEDGSFVGPMGYPRGYVGRTDAGFSGDAMNYLLPPLSSGRIKINNDDLLCHPDQRTQKQSDNYPVLKMEPGGFVAMKYLENGHVTLPTNQKGKAKSGGTVFVYGTTEPKDDEKIMDVLKWTEDGKGGDGRGTMIAAQNFDDGRCHQINGETISKERQQDFPDRLPDQPTSNVEQWCETDVKLPTDIDGSKLTVYWVWQWNTEPGADPTYPDGKDEYYTTCADINVGKTMGSQKNVAEKNTLQQQDPQTKAPENFQDRTAYIKFPLSTSGSDDETPTSTSTRPETTSTRTRSRSRSRTTATATTDDEGEDEPTTTSTPVRVSTTAEGPIYITVTVTEKAPASTTAAPSTNTTSTPLPRSRPVLSTTGSAIPRTTLVSRGKTPDQLAQEPKVQTDAPCTKTTSFPPSPSSSSSSSSASSSAADQASSARQDGDRITRLPGTLITSVSSSSSATRSIPKVIVSTYVAPAPAHEAEGNTGRGRGEDMIGKEGDEGMIGARKVRRDTRRKLGGARFPGLKELERMMGKGKGA